MQFSGVSRKLSYNSMILKMPLTIITEPYSSCASVFPDRVLHSDQYLG